MTLLKRAEFAAICASQIAEDGAVNTLPADTRRVRYEARHFAELDKRVKAYGPGRIRTTRTITNGTTGGSAERFINGRERRQSPMPRDPEFPALPAGNHTVTIQSAAISRRDGNLWVELEVGSEKGVQHDAMACGDRGDVRRLATIFEVAGVGLGRNADGGISEAALAQLVGKRIGVVVRREQILGYAPAARFAAGQTEGMPPTIRC